jgi:16S rRNA (guanine527-N7)-methyltransferase
MMMTDQTHSKPADHTAKPSASPDAPSHADRGTLELGLYKVEPLSPPPGWLDRCAQAGIVLENDEPARLGHFLAMLMHANTRMNLTAVRDEQEAWDRHIFDALTLIPMLSELEPNAKVIDIGTGGGIPGVPLAIVMPTLRFTLMDATKKKCDYLYEAVTALGMDNARVICARAEALGQDRGERTATGRVGAHRDHYDLAMARGVGQIAMLAELTIPLVKVGGLVLMTKGQRAEEELAEAKQALHMLHAAHAGTIDTPTGKVVVLEKMRTTPRDYPRRDGEPKRSPLGISKK